MDMNEIYSPSNLISKSISSAKNDPFFVILVGAIQIMITTAHWTCLGLAIRAYQTFLPEVVNHPGIPNLLAEMALVFGISLISSIFLVFIYIFDSLYRNISLQYLKNSIAGEEVSFEDLTDTTGILKMLKWRGINHMHCRNNLFVVASWIFCVCHSSLARLRKSNPDCYGAEFAFLSSSYGLFEGFPLQWRFSLCLWK